MRTIAKPALIYVGETILIPPRSKNPQPSNGTKAEGGQPPIPIELKYTYTIGQDTPPIVYVTTYGDYSIKLELSGEIGLENLSMGTDKFMQNFELVMSKDPTQIKCKPPGGYDAALVALTAKPGMVYEAGRVKLNAPIAANAKIGPYAIEVQAVTPLQMSGNFKPPTVKSDLVIGQRKFRYSADIEFKVDVFWHPRPKNQLETAKASEPVRKVAPVRNPIKSTKWDQMVDEKGVIVAVVLITIIATGSILYRIVTKGGLQPAQTMPSFIHTIDRENPTV